MSYETLVTQEKELLKEIASKKEGGTGKQFVDGDYKSYKEKLDQYLMQHGEEDVNEGEREEMEIESKLGGRFM